MQETELSLAADARLQNESPQELRVFAKLLTSHVKDKMHFADFAFTNINFQQYVWVLVTKNL